jgi:hypothetical protein
MQKSKGKTAVLLEELVGLGREDVFPCGIGSLDQFDLLGSGPAFEFLFSGDCAAHVAKIFAVDEAMNVVLRCVSAGNGFSVAVDSAVNVVGNSDIEVRERLDRM